MNDADFEEASETASASASEMAEADVEDRPVPAIAPATLLEGLSKLWGYPWEGLAASEETLSSLEEVDALAPWRDDLRQLSSDLEAYEAPSESIANADAYQLEYTRLFIGSFKMYAPPYASYYVDGQEQVYGPTTVEIEDLYAQFGIELAEGEHDMPDHLRFLLAFLSMLATSYEVKGNAEFAYAYEDFKADYIDPWIGKFAANVNEFAEFPFFKTLIAFTRRVLRGSED